MVCQVKMDQHKYFQYLIDDFFLPFFTHYHVAFSFFLKLIRLQNLPMNSAEKVVIRQNSRNSHVW